MKKVAIVGAGPAGLVTLKYLLTSHNFLGTEPVEVKLFEAEDGIGGTFYARMYENGELVSSKQLTCFSDFRARDDEPDFLAATRYREYLNEYATKFQLWPHINLKTRVTHITRKVPAVDGARHVITYLPEETGKEEQWECDAVAICAGLHVTPNIPEIPGIEHVPTVLHSSQFKSRAQFGENKTVMVMGAGETGSDVAYLSATGNTKQTIMCHRYGFHFAPKRNLNPAIFPIFGGKPNQGLTIPLDNARAALFDTAYVHPLLRNSYSMWVFYNRYVRFILWLTTGTPGGYDQLVGEPNPELDHVSKMFFTKSNRAAAYVSKPYRGVLDRGIIERLRQCIIQQPIPETGDRQIDLAPWPERITDDGRVVFRKTHRPEYERMKNEVIKPDVVVFCTGYRQEFPFFAKQNSSGGKRYALANEADVRGIWHHDDPSVGFIGYLRPNLGAIPPLAEAQAQLWVVHLLAPEQLPKPIDPRDELHFRLWHDKESRIHYGIDHESYIYQLGVDIGAVMGFWEAIGRGFTGYENAWRIPLVWAFGANLNAKQRLRGPWKWSGAEKIVKGEMWEALTRRRWFFTISDVFWLSILPMAIFGPISFACWVYATLYWIIFGREPGYGGYDSYGNKIMSKFQMQGQVVNGMHATSTMMSTDGLVSTDGMVSDGIKMNGTQSKKVEKMM